MVSSARLRPSPKLPQRAGGGDIIVRLFSIARTAAVAAFTLGSIALLAPAPAEAQHRHGYSQGGGARYHGGRIARPHMGVAPRVSHRQRDFAPRGFAHRGGVYRPGVYRPGVRHPGWVAGPNWGHRPIRRHHNRHWPVAAGVGLGLVGAAAVANSGYYYAGSGYQQQCWLERRTVRGHYGHRVINVRVCPTY